MSLHRLFAAEDLIVPFAPHDKWEAISQLVGLLENRSKLPTEFKDSVLDQVMARERSMSTGMEHGIAIPHAAVDEIDEVLACMGVIKEGDGLSFESIDGQPARFVVLLVIPRAQKLLHIRTLADVARVLSEQSVRESILKAPDAKGAWEALAAGDAASSR